MILRVPACNDVALSCLISLLSQLPHLFPAPTETNPSPQTTSTLFSPPPRVFCSPTSVCKQVEANSPFPHLWKCPGKKHMPLSPIWIGPLCRKRCSQVIILPRLDWSSYSVPCLDNQLTQGLSLRAYSREMEAEV